MLREFVVLTQMCT